MSDLPVTDDTGLHSAECECVRCDAGYRPTELERAAAQRSLRLQQLALARQARPPDVWSPRERAMLPAFVVPPRPTPEQQAELDREAAAFRAGSPQQPRRHGT